MCDCVVKRWRAPVDKVEDLPKDAEFNDHCIVKEKDEEFSIYAYEDGKWICAISASEFYTKIEKELKERIIDAVEKLEEIIDVEEVYWNTIVYKIKKIIKKLQGEKKNG